MQNCAIPAVKKLEMVQKAFKYPELPDPDQRPKAAKPVKKELTEMELFDKQPATEVVPQMLAFDNIMSGMGFNIDNLLDSDGMAEDEDDASDDLEEEFKEMRARAKR